MATLVDETVETRPVPRDATMWNEREEGRDDGKADELSPEMVSLDFALRTCCFEGFEGKRMTYLYTAQLTCSNVMSTVVTARPLDTSAKRRSKQQVGGVTAVSNQQESTGTTNASVTAMHVYAQPHSNRKKVKKANGKYQAQLPSFHRSLPALPIPVSRLNRELMQERDTFMAQLQRERSEKQRLDNWAATKIQACYRGFRARPRVISYETRQRLYTMSSLRLHLSDMNHLLQPLAVATADDDADTKASPWRIEIQSHAGQKREFRVTKERKQYAATKIQSIVRGFLARCAFARRYARHVDEVYHAAIIRIQCMFRAFRLRARIATVVAKLQQEAAVQIQSLIRGIQARERVLTLTFERKCEQRRLAGLALQFTLPLRTHEIVRTSCLRVLVAHRKTPLQLAFKSPTWHEERQLLQIYKVASKLKVQRQWLLRLTVLTPNTKKRKKPHSAALRRHTSRFHPQQSVKNMHMLTAPDGSPRPASPTNGRRRPTLTGSPTNSRPASPATRG